MTSKQHRDGPGRKRKAKFYVGQVVRLDSGEYGRITKVLADGTAGMATVFVNIGGRFYEDLQSSVRGLTKHEAGR